MMTSGHPRVVAFGECMIELRAEAPGLMRQAFSGDTLNTAVYLSRLAGDAFSVGYATAVGAADPYSEAMLASWQAEGLETSLVSRRQGELPGIYTIQVDASGERFFSFWRQMSAAKSYFADPVSPLERELAGVDVLYVSGISLAILDEAGRERLLAAMQTVHQSGRTVVFDNNYRPRLWSSNKEASRVYQRAYACADIALITLGDEMDVAGWSEPNEALARIHAYPCAEVVVKRGGEPSLVRRAAQDWVAVAAERVARVVDTTAAGDSFGAGYLAARLRGLPPAEALSVGNRLAAAVIQCPGAIIPVEKMPAGLLA